MAIYRIPTSTADASYTQRTVLDGREYLLTFDWNGRAERWYLSIADADDQPIVQGVKVIANWPLLRRLTDERAPPGQIVAQDLTGNSAPPGLRELGGRVTLTYFDAAERAVILGST